MKKGKNKKQGKKHYTTKKRKHSKNHKIKSNKDKGKGNI